MFFWTMYQGYIGLATGILLITFGPWIVKGLQAGSQGKAFPKYQARYAYSLGLAIAVYLITFLVSEEAVTTFLEYGFTAGVIAGIGGKQLAREVLRLFGI